MGKIKQEAIDGRRWTRSNFEIILEDAQAKVEVIDVTADNEKERDAMIKELQKDTIKALQDEMVYGLEPVCPEAEELARKCGHQ